LGPGAGASVGALGALVSNFALGQGLWTPWQMLGWGLCGAAGGLLRPLVRTRLGFAAVGATLAFAFGAIQNLQYMLLLLQQPHAGGFAEPGRQSTPGLSAWAVLALVAAGHAPDAAATQYLRTQTGGSASDLELRALALLAAREDAAPLLDQIAALEQPDGTI